MWNGKGNVKVLEQNEMGEPIRILTLRYAANYRCRLGPLTEGDEYK
jgi:hypothetical protein